MTAAPWLDWLVVALIGALIGATEIISRDRDEPLGALLTLPGAAYILINASAAIFALLLTRLLGWTFGAESEAAIRWLQVIIAGFGAMALLRASFFTVRVGDQEVAVGPSKFLQTILLSVDSGVDRSCARIRSKLVSKIMKDVAFEKAYQALPSYCFALLQNLPQDVQDQFGRQTLLLRNAEMPEHIKSLLLGLALMNVVGDDVLVTAVDSLGAEIKVDQPARTPAVKQPA